MKVKVGDKIYSGEGEPIMVILEDKDKENIKNMAQDCTSYAVFPDNFGAPEEMREWMKDQ